MDNTAYHDEVELQNDLESTACGNETLTLGAKFCSFGELKSSLDCF